MRKCLVCSCGITNAASAVLSSASLFRTVRRVVVMTGWNMSFVYTESCWKIYLPDHNRFGRPSPLCYGVCRHCSFQLCSAVLGCARLCLFFIRVATVPWISSIQCTVWARPPEYDTALPQNAVSNDRPLSNAYCIGVPSLRPSQRLPERADTAPLTLHSGYPAYQNHHRCYPGPGSPPHSSAPSRICSTQP